MKILRILLVVAIAATVFGQAAGPTPQPIAQVVECAQAVVTSDDAAAFINNAHTLGCGRVEFDDLGIEYDDIHRLYIARATKIVIEK